MEEEPLYAVQYAISGRAGCACAACRKTKILIPKGELRIGLRVQGAYGKSDGFSYKWYHAHHFFEAAKAFRTRKPPASVKELHGFTSLDEVDQRHVHQLLQKFLSTTRETKSESGSSRTLYTEPLGKLIRRLSSLEIDDESYSPPRRSNSPFSTRRMRRRPPSPAPHVREDKEDDRRRYSREAKRDTLTRRRANSHSVSPSRESKINSRAGDRHRPAARTTSEEKEEYEQLFERADSFEAEPEPEPEPEEEPEEEKEPRATTHSRYNHAREENPGAEDFEALSKPAPRFARPHLLAWSSHHHNGGGNSSEKKKKTLAKKEESHSTRPLFSSYSKSHPLPKKRIS